MRDAPYYSIPVMDTIRAAWYKVYGSKASLWAGYAVVLVVMFFLYLLQTLFKNVVGINFIIAFASGFINFVVQCGLLYLGIQRAYDLPLNFRNMFRSLESPYIVHLIIFFLLQVVVILIAIALVILFWMILPINVFMKSIIYAVAIAIVIYVFVRWMLAPAFILDKNQRAIEAIKSSYQATQGNFWQLIGIMILEMLIVLVSMIPIFIGLIWTIPFAFILYGEMYKRLLANTETI